MTKKHDITPVHTESTNHLWPNRGNLLVFPSYLTNTQSNIPSIIRLDQMTQAWEGIPTKCIAITDDRLAEKSHRPDPSVELASFVYDHLALQGDIKQINGVHRIPACNPVITHHTLATIARSSRSEHGLGNRHRLLIFIGGRALEGVSEEQMRLRPVYFSLDEISETGKELAFKPHYPVATRRRSIARTKL